MSLITEASFRCQIKCGRFCVIKSGNIYDVTDFADRHPGGKKLIENSVGKDVTLTMEAQHGEGTHKHSKSALNILEKYYIGELQCVNGVKKQNSGSNSLLNHEESKGLGGEPENESVNGFEDSITYRGQKSKMTHANSSRNEDVIQFDDLIDWSKPVFRQVGSLGKNYDDWVHSPIDTTLRMFESDLVETFSKSYWWSVLLYWIPITSWLLWDAYMKLSAESAIWNLPLLNECEISLVWLPLLFLLGVMLWTLDEYIFHRWFFHCRPPVWSKFLISVHFLFHGQHHKSPMDKTRLLFPQVPATGLGIVLYVCYRLFAPPVIAQIIFAGTLVGYMIYDLTHYYLHHGSPSLAYFKDLKTYHIKHHFKSQNRGFGISSKLWDYPFGTLIE